MWSLPQPHARPFPVFVDEDHAGGFEGGDDLRAVADHGGGALLAFSSGWHLVFLQAHQESVQLRR